MSTGEPSEASCDSGRPATATGSGTGDCSSEADAWGELTEKISALPREHSLASSIAGFCYPGSIGASKAYRGVSKPRYDDSIIVTGTWATPAEQPPSSRPRGGSVSPDDLILTTAGPLGDDVTTLTPPASAQVAPHTTWTP